MKKPTGKSGLGSLHEDEEQLWHYTARSIQPLKKRQGRVQTTEAPVTANRLRGKDSPVAPATVKSPAAPAAAAKKAAKSPPIGEFERKNVRKIRSGRIEIEARIDLHGMRQDEAHDALVSFLRRCQNKGQRWVLVITGKGRAEEKLRGSAGEISWSRERGILKRNVPRWLEEPSIRPMIVSYTVAAIPHGGEGALYIHLRTKGITAR